MLAYTNTEMSKAEVIARVRAHREADEIIFGQYWTADGKGCMVGCIVHGGDHSRFPAMIGHPTELAHLADAIHEGLGSVDWPGEYLAAAPERADLSMVWPRWCLWMLRGLPEQTGITKAASEGVIALYAEWVETGAKPSADRFRAAAEAAWAAEAAAWAAWAAEAAWAAAAAARAAEVAEAARSKFWRDARAELLRLLAEAPVREEAHQ